MALEYRNYYIYLDKQVIALLLIVITFFLFHCRRKVRLTYLGIHRIMIFLLNIGCSFLERLMTQI